MAIDARRYLEALEGRRRTLRDEVEDDVAMLRGLSLEERGRILESVCRDAMAILRARPDAKVAMCQATAILDPHTSVKLTPRGGEC